MNLTAGAQQESPELRVQAPLWRICLIFQGLNFECNQELGEKGHL